jgi:hypothetical protein
MVALTRKQKYIAAEIREIAKLVHLDLEEVCAGPSLGKIEALDMLRRKFVIAEVIHVYTLIDEILSAAICQFFFSKDFVREWKRKKFRLFNYHVIEELSLLQKLRFARSIKPQMRKLAGEIEALNAMRNGLVHAFFPENLKRARPIWKGLSIFTFDGMKRFTNDTNDLVDSLWNIVQPY